MSPHRSFRSPINCPWALLILLAAAGCQPAPQPRLAPPASAQRYAPPGVTVSHLGAGPTVVNVPDAAASEPLATAPEAPESADAAPEEVAEGAAAGLRMLPGGVGVEDITLGAGPLLEEGRQVSMHYVGRLADGTVFDSSRKRGTPLRYKFHSGRMIKGWEEGTLGMRVGGVRRLLVPPHKGYGERGKPGTIPPNAIIEFEIEALDMR